ncbi:hypothetical protein B484DRAFT_401082 [Ochromonadaceae sp. CCMP2298]|nr:hypothetical protein B484DRAFT_401082 [Ochromonadaceae sp. CCMP2298]
MSASKRSADGDSEIAAKRARTKPFTSEGIIKGGVNSDTEWAVNLADKIAAGDVLRVKLSPQLQSSCIKVMRYKEKVLKIAALEKMDKEKDAYNGTGGSAHEDRGLLTIVAVWSGCALQAATAVPSYEKAVIQAAKHSFAPAFSAGPALVFELRGCRTAVLNPMRFLSDEVQLEQMSIHREEQSMGAFYAGYAGYDEDTGDEEEESGSEGSDKSEGSEDGADAESVDADQDADADVDADVDADAEDGSVGAGEAGEAGEAGAVDNLSVEDALGGVRYVGVVVEDDEEEEVEDEDAIPIVDDSLITLELVYKKERLFFEIKRSVCMQALMRSFALQKGVPLESLHFSIDRISLEGTKTGQDLYLEEGDEIVVLPVP